jgi:WD40 repeat protein
MPSYQKSNFLNNYFSGVVCICSSSDALLGTGFLIDYGDLVITCAHVLKNLKDDVRIYFWGNTVAIPAVVENASLNISKNKDIIVLKLLGDVPKDARRLSFGSYDGKRNDLITLGFPFPNSFQGIFAKCEIIGIDNHFGFEMFQVRSPEITLGFSGAPIVDKISEKVVAVVVSIVSTDRYGKLAETAFAISGAEVYSELLRCMASRSLSLEERSTVPVAFEPFVKSEKEEGIFLPSYIGVDSPYSDLETLIINVESNPSLVSFKLLRAALNTPRLITALNLGQYINSDFKSKVVAVAVIDTVYLIDLETLKVTNSIKQSSRPVIVSLSKDCQFLAVSNTDNKVLVWRIIDETCMAELAFDGKIEHLFFGTKNPTIISIGTWSMTKFFTVSDEVNEFSSISHARLARVFLRGATFAGLDINEKNIIVWDLPTNKKITTIHIEYPVAGLEFADDKSTTLLGIVNSELRWWNIRSGQTERILELGDKVNNLIKTETAEKLVVALIGGKVLVIDLNSRSIILSKDFPNEIKILSVESNCNKAIISHSDKNFLWDLPNDECVELPFSSSGMKSVFLRESIIILFRSNRVEFWDTRTFSRIFTMPAENLYNLSVSKGITTFIGASRPDAIKILDVVESVVTDLEFNDAINMDFNSQGTVLVASNTASEVAVWELRTKRLIRSKSDYNIALLKFVGEDKFLVVNSDHTSLSILSTNRMEVLVTLRLTKKVEAVACNMDGTIFGLYFVDGELKVYETLTCKNIFQLLDKSIVRFFFCSQTECLIINVHGIRIIDILSGKEFGGKQIRDKIFGVDFHNWSNTICVNWGNSVGVYTLNGQPLAQIDFETTIQRVNLINNGRWVMVIDDQDKLSIYPCEINELREIALRFLSPGMNLT